MLRWMSEHPELLSAAISFAMLIVWIAYLQLFVFGYIRRRRSNILINRSVAGPHDVRCLVSNMSAESIYVTSVIASIEADGRRWDCPITHSELEDEGLGSQPSSRQGPLAPGGYRDIGSFSGFFQRVQQRAPVDPQEGEGCVLELRIVAYYASEDLPVGALRRFAVTRDGETLRFTPETVGTTQIRSRRARRRIEEAVMEDVRVHPAAVPLPGKRRAGEGAG